MTFFSNFFFLWWRMNKRKRFLFLVSYFQCYFCPVYLFIWGWVPMKEVKLHNINIVFIHFLPRRRKTEERRLEMHLEENVINPDIFFFFFCRTKFLNKSCFVQ